MLPNAAGYSYGDWHFSFISWLVLVLLSNDCISIFSYVLWIIFWKKFYRFMMIRLAVDCFNCGCKCFIASIAWSNDMLAHFFIARFSVFWKFCAQQLKLVCSQLRRNVSIGVGLIVSRITIVLGSIFTEIGEKDGIWMMEEANWIVVINRMRPTLMRNAVLYRHALARCTAVLRYQFHE